MTATMTWLEEEGEDILSGIHSFFFSIEYLSVKKEKYRYSPTWLFLPLHLSYSFSCPSRVPLWNSCAKIVNLLYLCFLGGFVTKAWCNSNSFSFKTGGSTLGYSITNWFDAGLIVFIPASAKGHWTHDGLKFLWCVFFLCTNDRWPFQKKASITKLNANNKKWTRKTNPRLESTTTL